MFPGLLFQIFQNYITDQTVGWKLPIAKFQHKESAAQCTHGPKTYSRLHQHDIKVIIYNEDTALALF